MGAENMNGKSLEEKKAEIILQYLLDNIDDVEDGDFDTDEIKSFIDKDNAHNSAVEIFHFVRDRCNDADYDDDDINALARIIRKRR